MDERLNTIFSENLKRYLEQNGKTQADLCTFMHVSSATVSDWCNGKKMPRVDKIQAICNWLNIGLDVILSDSSSQNTTEHYYFDDEAREMIEFLHDNPKYKLLFDASRKVKAEDIDFVRQMIERFSE